MLYWIAAVLQNGTEVSLWHHNPNLGFRWNRKPWEMPKIPKGTTGLSVYGRFDDFETNAQNPMKQHGLTHFQAVFKEVGMVTKFNSYIAISSFDNGELYADVSPKDGQKLDKLFKRARRACRLLQRGLFLGTSQ